MDLVLIGTWAALILVVSLTIPGVTNLIVTWVGGVALLWYDDTVRHDSSGVLRSRWVAGAGAR
jgi:hypothetical protein